MGKVKLKKKKLEKKFKRFLKMTSEDRRSKALRGRFDEKATPGFGSHG